MKKISGRRIIVGVSLLGGCEGVSASFGILQQFKNYHQEMFREFEKGEVQAKTEEDVFSSIMGTTPANIRPDQVSAVLEWYEKFPFSDCEKTFRERSIEILRNWTGNQTSNDGELSDESSMFGNLLKQTVFLQRREEALEYFSNLFPLEGFRSITKDILCGKCDDAVTKEVTYTGQAFNISYGEGSFFDTFSRRIVFLLSIKNGIVLKEIFRRNAQLRFLVWLGLARALIDRFSKMPSKTMSRTDFGKYVDYRSRLVEPWNQSFPGEVRMFMLQRFRGISRKAALQERTRPVRHRYAGDFSFLQKIEDVLELPSSSDCNSVRDAILSFVFEFSCSSIYSRGQSAIMEWIYHSLARIHGFRFELAGTPSLMTSLACLQEDIRELERLEGLNIKDQVELFNDVNSICVKLRTSKFQSIEELRVSLGGCVMKHKAGTYGNLLENAFCELLLNIASSHFLSFGIQPNESFSNVFQKMLAPYVPPTRFYIRECAEEMTSLVESGNVFSFNRYITACKNSLNKFKSTTFFGYEPKKMSILDTWGWIFTHGILFHRSEESSESASSEAFDLDEWERELIFSINKLALSSLYTHLDGIALEIFGSVQEDPAPELMQQLFQRFLKVARPLVQLTPLSSEQELSPLEFEESSQEE